MRYPPTARLRAPSTLVSIVLSLFMGWSCSATGARPRTLYSMQSTYIRPVTKVPDVEPRVFDIEVLATKGWQATNVDVAEEDVLEISASGSWSYYYWRSRPSGPEGVELRELDGEDVSGFPYMALLGRIGDGHPFVVGRGTTVAVEHRGQLFFEPNDLWVSSNKGSLNVQIKIYRPLRTRHPDLPDCDLNSLPQPDMPPSVAVLDFQVSDDLNHSIGESFADVSRDAVLQSGRFVLIERENIRAILAEEDFAATFKCDDTKCLVDYGKKLRAQKIIHGRVNRIGESFLITIKILDVASASIEGLKTAKVKGGVEFALDYVQPVTCEILRDSLVDTHQ